MGVKREEIPLGSSGEKTGTPGVMLTKLADWGRSQSLWPMTFGLAEMLVFVAILLVGYVYVWKRGAFRWE